MVSSGLKLSNFLITKVFTRHSIWCLTLLIWLFYSLSPQVLATKYSRRIAKALTFFHLNPPVLFGKLHLNIWSQNISDLRNSGNCSVSYLSYTSLPVLKITELYTPKKVHFTLCKFKKYKDRNCQWCPNIKSSKLPNQMSSLPSPKKQKKKMVGVVDWSHPWSFL